MIERTVGHRLALVGVFAAALASQGCGSSDYAPVSGVVTFNGEPVEGATITFEPVEGVKPSYATTDAVGRYELAVAGLKGQMGAAIGNHRVKVTAIAEPSTGTSGDPGLGSPVTISSPPKIRYLVPSKYDDFNTSGLSFTVTPSGSDQADFSLAD